MEDFERHHKMNKDLYGIKNNLEDDCRDIFKIEGDLQGNHSYRQLAKLYKTELSRQYVLNVFRIKKDSGSLHHYLSDKPMLVIENCNWKTAEIKSCQFLEGLLFNEFSEIIKE